LKSFKIGGLEIPVPIIQGGMGVGVSLSGLASAVACRGGVGVISTVGIGLIGNKPYFNYRQTNIDALRIEIQKARKLTKGILGVNIMVAISNFVDMVKTSIEEEIDIIFSGAGLPLDLPKFLKKDSKTRLVPIVSSARAASIICKKWKQSYNYTPDAIVVEGPKAGGHLGFKKDQITNKEHKLEKLVSEVVEETHSFKSDDGTAIPIIAAGGIYTGKDIFDIMALGASAVQMGTRFVATRECDASIGFKNSFLNATATDVAIIKSPVGMPGRVIINSFFSEVEEGKRKPLGCRHHCIRTCDFKTTPYCIANALVQAQMGNMQDGFAFAGSNVDRVNEITSVEILMNSLITEYEEANQLNSLTNLVNYNETVDHNQADYKPAG
jgi:nitronate monooxygenase